MDLAAFEAAVAKGDLPRRFLLFGGREEYLKERVLGQLVAKFVEPGEITDNVFRIDFNDAAPEAFLQQLDSFCFGTGRRLFFLSHPEGLSAAERKKIVSPLASGKAPADVVVIFLSTESDKLTEIGKALEGSCERIDFWPPFANMLPGWISKTALECGARIAQDASDLLLSRIGDDLRLLAHEIEKLAVQAGKNGTITLAMVSGGVAYSRQDTIFDLIEQVGLRRLPEALRILESLLLKGEAPIGIWYMLQKTLRDYRVLHDTAADRPDLMRPVFDALGGLLKIHGKSDYRANQERKRLVSLIQEAVTGCPPFLREALNLKGVMQIGGIALALNYHPRELRRIWPRLLEIDQTMKSSPPSLAFTLETFIFDLISRNRA
ncbi:MAG: DNA polymerase III subunit delta [Candidatus Riflebacteria bacterium]|nr:DNA polymerase III subunit delta [Candidatus Riflebacteria bacterium]